MRKYSNYIIEIIHLNGNKQIKKCNNTSCYKSTLSLYKETRENYAGKNVTINFVGISEEERCIIFSKKNSRSEDNKKDIKTLIDDITILSSELSNKLREVSDMTSLIDKRKSNIEHLFIESINVDILDDNKKIDVFNQLREITLERRDYKILNQIKSAIINEVKDIIKLSDFISKEYDRIIQTHTNISESLITDENSHLKDTHVVKEYAYKNFKERMNLMNQLKPKYDKIVHDDVNKKLLCYNKCKNQGALK